MSFRTQGPSAKRRSWPLATVATLAALSTQCDPEEYSGSPTFCDDWCQAFLRKDCEQEPENCVRNCERSLAEEPCSSLQRTLLDCYRAASPDDFVCSGSGFRAQALPKESTCQAPRDALIECAYPDVRLCLDLCRAVESTLADASVADAGNADANSQPSDRQCPSEDIPCDSICWLAGSYLSSPSDAGSDTTNDGSYNGSNPFGAHASQLIDCALGKAELCRQGQPAGPDAGLSDENWRTVLTSCAEELGLVD